MNVLLINLSPRKKGTSAMLLSRCMQTLSAQGHSAKLLHLYPHLHDLSELRGEVAEADMLVFCGPCYINTYPADTIALLQDLYAHKEVLHGQKVYGIIQGGMPYAHVHACGLNLLCRFAQKSGLHYMGGFVMGLGAMLNGQGVQKLPHAKKVEKQLAIFFEHIAFATESPDEVFERAQLRLPRFVFRLMAVFVNRNIDREQRRIKEAALLTGNEG